MTDRAQDHNNDDTHNGRFNSKFIALLCVVHSDALLRCVKIIRRQHRKQDPRASPGSGQQLNVSDTE